MNILISSAGRRVALLRLFRAALGEVGVRGRVLAADMRPMSAAFHDADAAFTVPACGHEDFVPAMLAHCEREEIDLIVPTIDPELPVYAAHLDRFADLGVHVVVPGPAAVAISGDKVATHRFLCDHGFPSARQAPLGEVLADPSGWEFPVVVKPRRGSASMGVRVVDDVEGLGASTHGDADELIVQSYVGGVELTVDVYVDARGEVRCTVPRRRLEVRAGEVSKGVTVRHPEVQELCAQLAASLPREGHVGPHVVTPQVKVDGDRMAVIELNARFGGGYPLAWAAGARFPVWLLEERLGRDPDTGDDWRDGVVMLRYDDAVFVSAADAGL